MRRFLSPVLLLLSCVFIFASCLKNDNDEVTLYDDTAITSFQITTAKIYHHTLSSAGADSVYVETSTAVSNYPFSINQQTGEISNIDSLPVGTDASKLLCSYSSKNNGYVMIQNIGSDTIRYLSTTDSTDFSVPRTLKVLSSDGKNSRDYTVNVKIHKEDGDKFVWQSMPICTSFTSLSSMKAVAWGNRLFVFGNENGQTVGYISSQNGTDNWTKIDGYTFSADAYKSVAIKDNQIFILDNGVLKKSSDGNSFSDIVTNPALLQLLGASRTEMYALSADSTLMVSTDNGETWSVDDMDDNKKWLPTENISLCDASFNYSDSTDYVLLAGNRSLSEDTTATVWRKIVEYGAVKEHSQWSHIAFDDTNHNPLARLDGLTVLPYDNKFIAFGIVGQEQAFSKIYESIDGGITWKVSSSYTLPSAFTSSISQYVATVDSDNYIWLISGQTGRVWKGRLNRLGWK